MRLSPYDIECLHKARELIHADLRKHHPISRIAEHAGLGMTKLRGGFKYLFRTGLYDYLKEKRLEEAKHLLKNTYEPIKTISHRVGYEHACNFITAFKKRFGMSPGDWRNKGL